MLPIFLIKLSLNLHPCACIFITTFIQLFSTLHMFSTGSILSSLWHFSSPTGVTCSAHTDCCLFALQYCLISTQLSLAHCGHGDSGWTGQERISNKGNVWGCSWQVNSLYVHSFDTLGHFTWLYTDAMENSLRNPKMPMQARLNLAR